MTARADDDLLGVPHDLGQIQLTRPRVASQSTGRPDGVHHPRVLRQR